MDIDANKLLENALRDGLREGVKKQFESTYNNPLTKLIESSLATQSVAFRELLNEAIAGCVNDPDFRSQITTAVRHSIAKNLVQRFGGEVEKQVNALKSDPTTRARITLAIEEIVKTAS